MALLHSHSYSFGCEAKIYEIFKEKFHWFNVIFENEFSWEIPFNTIIKEKLFGLKDINRYIFGVPNNIAEIIKNSFCVYKYNDYGDFGYRTSKDNKKIKLWKTYLKYLDGVQNLTSEFVSSEYFEDSCRMAKILGRKVNCRWGLKRLKEEHDNWSREIANIKFALEETYQLNIKDEYLKFAEFSGFSILKNNKEMLVEGMAQNHCVGTYIDKVNNGSCEFIILMVILCNCSYLWIPLK